MKLRIVPSVLCLMLTACAGQETAVTEALPSDEVLQRAAEAAQKIESAQYLATADVSIESGSTWHADAVVRMDGNLQNAGEQIRAMTDVTAEVEDSQTGDYALNGTVELVVMDKDNEVYMNLHTLSSQPDGAFFPSEVIQQLTGTWWRLPSADTPPATATVTPDPRLLQAQSQVVTVTQSSGIEPFAGSDAYHYNVELNRDKLKTYLLSLAEERNEELTAEEIDAMLENVTATGELWIDAHTYFLHKITWEIRSLQYAQGGSVDLDVTITLRNHNEAPVIEPPQGAKQFTPAALFALPSDMYGDPQIMDPAAGYDEDAMDDLLQNLNSFE